jgi:hypothetical protein
VRFIQGAIRRLIGGTTDRLVERPAKRSSAVSGAGSFGVAKRRNMRIMYMSG